MFFKMVDKTKKFVQKIRIGGKFKEKIERRKALKSSEKLV